MSATRLRYLLCPREVTNRTHLQVLSVYRDHGVIPKDSRSDNFNKTPEDITRYQEVRIGDLVVNKMKAWQGSERKRVSSEYLVWTLLSSRTKRFIDDVTQGSLHPHLNMPDIGSILVGDISLAEQEAVGRRLASAIGELEALNELRGAQLAVLAERRQALITAAVTGGIAV